MICYAQLDIFAVYLYIDICADKKCNDKVLEERGEACKKCVCPIITIIIIIIVSNFVLRLLVRLFEETGALPFIIIIIIIIIIISILTWPK